MEIRQTICFCAQIIYYHHSNATVGTFHCLLSDCDKVDRMHNLHMRWHIPGDILICTTEAGDCNHLLACSRITLLVVALCRKVSWIFMPKSHRQNWKLTRIHKPELKETEQNKTSANLSAELTTFAPSIKCWKEAFTTGSPIGIWNHKKYRICIRWPHAPTAPPFPW